MSTKVESVETADSAVHIAYVPYGAGKELFESRDPELCLDGPAGTAKTTAILNKLHACLLKYPGARALVARKRNTDLAGSAMVTFREHVLRAEEGVRYFGGNKIRPAAFQYPNGPDASDPYEGGSELVVNGLDKPEKVKSTEFDLAYINEATECTEEDVEFVKSRLRHYRMPYQQLVLDCNPGPPTHWLNVRMNPRGTTFDASVHSCRRVLSRHQDNPRYFDRVAQQWTAEGRAYIEGTLGSLTGVRRLRLKDGLWAAAEGVVYDEWQPDVHILKRFTIPQDWPRYWVCDFGYNDPFVCQWWAVGDDGRLYRYRELYMTGRLVEDHARQILRASGYELRGGTQLVRIRDDADPLPRAVICDHDLEDRKTLEKHTRLTTVPAYKERAVRIQAMKARLRVDPATGKARLYYLQDSLIERDPELARRKKPTCSEEEIEGYIWKRSPRLDHAEDEPMDGDDHGMDCSAYMVGFLDCRNNIAARGPNVAALPRVGLYRP